jgi:hypothetical protein
VARHLTTTTALAVSVVIAIAVVAGCSTPAATPPAAGSAAPKPLLTPPATRTAPAPVTTPVTATTGATLGFGAAAADPGAVPTGTGWQAVVLDQVPDPPRLVAVPADFTSPEAVAAAYLQAWCYAPADQPANSNLADAAPWMTAAGWADDTTRAVDDPSWVRTQEAGVTTVCGPATARVSSQAPVSPDETWVQVSAVQVRVAGGAVVGQSPVVMVRRVLRAVDGRWLVDVRVLAG